MVNVTIYSIHGSYGMWNTPQSNSCLLDLFMYEHVQGALCWSSSFLDGWNIIQFLEYPIMNSHEIHGFFSFFTTFPMKNMEFPMEFPWNCHGTPEFDTCSTAWSHRAKVWGQHHYLDAEKREDPGAHGSSPVRIFGCPICQLPSGKLT